jgi:hypothetical protein
LVDGAATIGGFLAAMSPRYSRLSPELVSATGVAGAGNWLWVLMRALLMHTIRPVAGAVWGPESSCWELVEEERLGRAQLVECP